MFAPEAFQLLTLPNASLTTSGRTERGLLNLECVTISLPEAASERDVYLVLRINSSETPIDPARVIERSDGTANRTYTFSATHSEPNELVLTVDLPPNGSNPQLLEDIDTFESIIGQYAENQIRGPANAVSPVVGVKHDHGEKDLRGHLVMINEDTGEVVGEVEDRFRINEDPSMHKKGHENDPVVIEVPEETPGESDASAMEVFARIVPPDQQDWITQSATVVSHAISMTTNLLLTTITTASSYYINNSTPSTHHSSSRSSAAGPSSASGPPPPLPPRALVSLTSERTRKGLSTVHAVTGQAVKVSAKTVSVIDNMIRQAMGAKPKREKAQFFPGSSSTTLGFALGPGAAPRRTPSPKPGGFAAPPPPYESEKGGYPSSNKPSLPPRRGNSPVPPPMPPRTSTGIPDNMAQNPIPTPKLTKKDRVLISADLILSTIDNSMRKILDTGTENFGNVVGHKYGPEAKESSLMMAGSARNVGLVYIDMRGIGRRALLKRAGKTYISSKFSSAQSGSVQAPEKTAAR